MWSPALAGSSSEFCWERSGHEGGWAGKAEGRAAGSVVSAGGRSRRSAPLGRSRDAGVRAFSLWPGFLLTPHAPPSILLLQRRATARVTNPQVFISARVFSSLLHVPMICPQQTSRTDPSATLAPLHLSVVPLSQKSFFFCLATFVHWQIWPLLHCSPSCPDVIGTGFVLPGPVQKPQWFSGPTGPLRFSLKGGRIGRF